MKLKVLLPTAMLLGLIHVAALAQENAQPDGNANSKESSNRAVHIEPNSTDEKNPMVDFETKSSQSAQQKEEVAAPKKEETTKIEKKAAEEDPLSFNFLYLIIQKFKISDIVQDE